MNKYYVLEIDKFVPGSKLSDNDVTTTSEIICTDDTTEIYQSVMARHAGTVIGFHIRPATWRERREYRRSRKQNKSL